MGASMKPLAGPHMTVWATLNVVIFYGILFCSMFYFFFSFEHKHPVVSKTAATGRWFLMIGFGTIFGATVMGRMTLFIGRFNFLLADWVPQVSAAWGSGVLRVVAIVLGVAAVTVIVTHLALRSGSRGNS